jgi:hypothetical protein
MDAGAYAGEATASPHFDAKLFTLSCLFMPLLYFNDFFAV